MSGTVSGSLNISDMDEATFAELTDVFVLQRTPGDQPSGMRISAEVLLAFFSSVTITIPGSTEQQTTSVAELAEKLSFFTVASGRLCINREMLSKTPTTDGEIYDNGGFLGINYES